MQIQRTSVTSVCAAFSAALGKEMPQGELAAHLHAAGAGPDAVREREEQIRRSIALDEERHAARRMSRDRGMSM